MLSSLIFVHNFLYLAIT